MEKIKLKNGVILEITPMGINENTITKQREFKIISILTYSEIETLFSDSDNISNIQYLSDSDEILKTYLDCMVLKVLSKEKDVEINDVLTTDIYKIELSTDAIEKKMQALQDTVDMLIISGLGV